MYQGKGIPVLGHLYIFSDCICFCSKFSSIPLLQTKTRIKIFIKDLIFCEFLPKKLGGGMALTCSSAEGIEGNTFQFCNLGESGNLVCSIIQDFMEGFENRKKQRMSHDDNMLT